MNKMKPLYSLSKKDFKLEFFEVGEKVGSTRTKHLLV